MIGEFPVVRVSMYTDPTMYVSEVSVSPRIRAPTNGPTSFRTSRLTKQKTEDCLGVIVAAPSRSKSNRRLLVVSLINTQVRRHETFVAKPVALFSSLDTPYGVTNRTTSPARKNSAVSDRRGVTSTVINSIVLSRGRGVVDRRFTAALTR